MKSSRRDLAIDMAIYRSIFKTNRVTADPCSTFTPKTGMALPIVGDSFYCAHAEKIVIGLSLLLVIGPNASMVGVEKRSAAY